MQQETWTQVLGTYMSVSVLSKQIIKQDYLITLIIMKCMVKKFITIASSVSLGVEWKISCYCYHVYVMYVVYYFNKRV